MAGMKPFGIIKEKYLQLDGKNSFHVNFKNMNKEYFCVMDIYPMISPIHPQRHPGWFRFDIVKDGDYEFVFRQKENEYFIESLDGLDTIDKWQSSNLDVNILPASVRIVIRKKINNEIVFEDKIICYTNQHEYLEQEEYFASVEKSIEDLPLVTPIIPRKLSIKIVLKSFVDGDAIGYFVWETYALLKKMGIETEIYSQTCEDKFRPFIHSITELLTDDKQITKDTVILYNYSICDDYLDDLLDLSCKKIAYFHGITDPKSIRVFDAELAQECQQGLDMLYKIKGFDRIIVNSQKTGNILYKHICENEFREETRKGRLRSMRALSSINENSQMLKAKKIVFQKIMVLPPVIISESVWRHISSDGQFFKSIEKIGDVLLYVGRMYPHKRVEEIVAVFKEILTQNQNAILLLIGGTHNSYQKYLQHRINELPKAMQERIVSIPQVSRNQLKAAYEGANAFITMSEDEGFCVPILEAMRFKLPVFARKHDNSAADELLDGTGKLICNKDYESIASEINHVFMDQEYREKIIAEQNTRVKNYEDNKLMKKFLNILLGCYYDENFN